MPVQPIDHPLNLTMQTILTVGSWSLTLVFLIMAVIKDKRDGCPFYTLLVLAGLCGAYAEPLYDVGFMLWFYTPGIWSHFTAFAIPQPNWTHSGYVVLYSGTAMLIVEAIRNGLDRTGLFKWWLIALSMSMAFEITGINCGAYTYWGPHAFRIFDYPLVIGVLEATQVICYSVIASLIRTRATSNLQFLGLLVLFPSTFFMINFGVGSPVIIGLHWPTVTPWLVQVTSIISILASIYCVYIASKVLPATRITPQATPLMS
ncbi:hypothetical protein G8770_04310 [Aestuariicella hydrocarbonica]|uniref:Uncharacterized protein n=1 Tax=Pseudomaricurvus hydrocarbonicus TaxID=1470433 RepID=A0A9E5JSJ3_9GAMM|nr:hypothetical protein [Aestuariicella hydrocarbonica]NHO64768.1 hypothetical protein [Aestuariicella hydrocarbonica]